MSPQPGKAPGSSAEQGQEEAFADHTEGHMDDGGTQSPLALLALLVQILGVAQEPRDDDFTKGTV